MNITKLKAETLKWCNARRAEKKMEPLRELPKGIPCDPESCPCGAATGLYVGADRYCELVNKDNIYHIGVGVRLPIIVEQFTDQFDRGKIPELIRPGSEKYVFDLGVWYGGGDKVAQH